VSSMSNRALFTSNRKSRPLLTQGLMGRRKLVDKQGTNTHVITTQASLITINYFLNIIYHQFQNSKLNSALENCFCVSGNDNENNK